MYERSRNLLDCHIAGFTYYEGLDVMDELRLGAVVTLKAEPENPYDPNAVVIYFEDTKLGYIPQAKNAMVSLMLHFGYGEFLEARINGLNREATPESQFRIVVKLRDNREV
jgi:hypothetical protein